MKIDFTAKHKRKDFTLDMALSFEGPVTALFGPSGSGKTTVLNILGGLLRPQEGRIVVDGEVWFDSQAKIWVPAHKRRIGYVFQDARLFPHLSVGLNLRIGGWLRRSVRAKDKRSNVEWDDVIDLLGLNQLLARKPGTLSGGEQQRVGIARALLANPKVLLMDEPLAALDEARRAEILPYIERLQSRFAIPTIYVSHAREEVERIADEIITMKDGSVVGVRRGSDFSL